MRPKKMVTICLCAFFSLFCSHHIRYHHFINENMPEFQRLLWWKITIMLPSQLATIYSARLADNTSKKLLFLNYRVNDIPRIYCDTNQLDLMRFKHSIIEIIIKRHEMFYWAFDFSRVISLAITYHLITYRFDFYNKSQLSIFLKRDLSMRATQIM